MTVTLPVADLQFPLVRILVMPQGHWTDARQPWEILPATARFNASGRRYYGRAHGYELDSVEQVALPDVGAAVFHFDYGEINNVSYTETTGTENTNARDLIGYDVRIQLAPVPAASAIESNTAPTLTWATVFLGTIIAQDDDPFVGATAAGRRTYRCADLLYRTMRWPMNRHNAAAVSATDSTDVESYYHALGHPGYNYAVQGYYRRLLGNRYNGITPFVPLDVWGDNPLTGTNSNLANYLAHTWTGTGLAITWNDLQVVNHALVSSRLKGEPLLKMVDAVPPGTSSLSLLASGTFSWSVNMGESCWDFINRILDRKRGRGLSRLTWTELADTTDNITPGITIYPQTLDNITVTNPSTGGTYTYYGATTIGTTKAVDLIGDHRMPDNGINISQNGTATVDYLESFGEPIEILVTLSPGDTTTIGNNTLQKRWGATEEAAFAAIDADHLWQRNFDRWRPIWQRWSVPQNWDFNVSDGSGDGTVSSPVNYYCNDDGSLGSFDFASASDTTGVGEPSPLTCRIMSDLPIYEGYDYSGTTPVRYDGATDQVSPPRMPPLVLLRDSADKTLFTDMTQLGTGICNDDFGVLVIYGNDQNAGTRFFSDPTEATLGSNAGGYQCLVVTVGLQLSHRVRIASHNGTYGPLDAPRKKSLYFPGIFLWLADPNAIWSFNYTIATSLGKMPIFRDAGAASPGILRDDRNALASLHALAWQWYSITHRTGYWTLRDCGLLPSFTDAVAGAVTYTTVGKLITTITASGTTYTMNAPCTRVTYNHTSGTTVWTVDWNDLDIASS